jgi:predicted DNA-binding transcriptional regulator YafY
MANIVMPSRPTSRTGTTPQSPMALSSAEIAALALSLAHLGGGPQAVTARRALRRLLDAELDLRPEDPMAEGDVIVDTLATLTTPLNDTTASRARILAAGISERMAVRLHYRDAGGSLSVRDVEPVTCLVHRDHWYLVAWCRLRRGIRAFRFDRLLAVEPTDTPARAHRAERFLPFQRRSAA